MKDDKTLYLQTDKTIRVQQDGPSLLVLVDGVAPRRYPLRRVNRVVCSPAADWTGQALAACLSAGTPITFLSTSGEALGHALPNHMRFSPLSQRLEDFLARPNWKRLYENWRRAAERREIRRTLARLRLRAPDLRPEPVRALLEDHLRRLGGPQSPALVRYWQSLSGAVLVRVVTDERMETRVLAGRRPGFHFLADLNAILCWQAYAAIGEFLASAGGGTATQNWRAAVTACFEQRSGEDEKRIRSLLDYFMYWLGGLR